MTTTATHTIAPPDLWAIARDLICDLFNLFGEPQHIATLGFIPATLRAHMLTWLRATEAVLRHLLLIEAAALMPSLPPASPARAQCTMTRTRAARACIDDPAAPETWRVSFRCFLERRRPRRRDADNPSQRARISRRVDPYARDFIDAKAAAMVRANKAAWLAEMNQFSSPARGGSVSAQRAMTTGALVTRSPSDRFATTSPARGGGNSKLHASLPLARRAEAMLRAFNTPLRFARRIARRLLRKPKDAPLLLGVPADIDRALDRGSLRRIHDAALATRPADSS